MKYTDMDLNHKTILITGGAGFIGSNTALHIQNNYPHAHIVVFDAFVLGHFKNLIGFQGDVIAGDITSSHDLERLKEYKFDIIFHFAAISDTTVVDQKAVIQANTNAFSDILALAKLNNAAVVYASSAGVYGNSPAPNCVGTGEKPENVYGFSKLMMDHVASRFVKENAEMSIVGLRYFNVYGSREVYKGKTASMILQMGLQLLQGKNPRLFKYGEQKRDFVYIEDVIQANIKAIHAPSGVYNVGSGAARQYNEVYGILTHELDTFIEVEYIDNPYKFFQNHTEADITLTKAKLGYSPRFNLENGINAYKEEIKTIYKRELA